MGMIALLPKQDVNALLSAEEQLARRSPAT
jgi:hypothetical protein